MNLTPYISIWVVMAVSVLALAAYRLLVGLHEGDSLHISENEAHLVDAQTKISRRIQAVDRWGILLTVIAVLYGLIIGAVYLYHVWLESTKVHWR